MQSNNVACYGVKETVTLVIKTGFPRENKGGFFFEDFKAKEGTGGFPVIGYAGNEYADYRDNCGGSG